MASLFSHLAGLVASVFLGIFWVLWSQEKHLNLCIVVLYTQVQMFCLPPKTPKKCLQQHTWAFFFFYASVFLGIFWGSLEAGKTSELVYSGIYTHTLICILHLHIYRCDRSVTILVLIISLAQVVFSAPFTPIYVQVYIYIHGCVCIYTPTQKFRCYACLQRPPKNAQKNACYKTGKV